MSSRREKSRKLAQRIKVAVVVLVLGVGGYFAFGYAREWQSKLNAKSREATKNSDGGELGHIANLYAVLDATDTTKHGGGISFGKDDDMPAGREIRQPGQTPPAIEEKELPVIPAAWTLDLDAAQIPAGRANGRIAGTNFVADLARLDRAGQSYVLTLRQGAGVSGDQEILIYLGLNIDENFPGFKWAVSRDMKGAKVPQVVKRWKTNPKFAPLQKSFGSGYAMNLELGAFDEDTISGKIFVALPDAEQSVVAGLFKVRFMPAVTVMPGEVF